MLNSITCTFCDNECSSEAVSCPKCGQPLKVGASRRWLYLSVGLGVVLLVTLALGAAGVFMFGSYGNSLIASLTSGLSTEQRKAVDEAIQSLKKLDSASNIGITKPEYSRLLIEASPVVDKAVGLLPNGELKTELSSAIGSYLDAKQLWGIMKDDDSILVMCNIPGAKPPSNKFDLAMTELACNPEGKILKDKYRIPVRDRPSGAVSADQNNGSIVKKEGLSVIWSEASKHVELASSIAKGKGK